MPLSSQIGSSRVGKPGVCTSLTRPASPYEGMVIYETDTDKVLVWNSSTWLQIQTLDASGRSLVPNQVVFQAHGPVVSAAHGTNPVILTNTYINIGGGYSSSTGKFTAPAPGTYFFWWSFLSGTVDTVYRWYIRKNNVRIGDLHLRADTAETGSAYNINATATTYIQLAQGDEVTLDFTCDNSGVSFYNGGGNEYSRFGGHLIG